MKDQDHLDTDLKILIVDDDSIMRESLKIHLTEIGFNDIVEAEDGNHALDLLSKSRHTFHILISDWYMPHLSGEDLLKAVRSKKQYKDLVFIFLTVEDSKEEMKRIFEEGVDGYIVKPYSSVDEIKNALISGIERREKSKYH